jgi:hypothetical protein
MQAIDLIRGAPRMTDESTAGLAADMGDATMTRTSSRGGNQ